MREHRAGVLSVSSTALRRTFILLEWVADVASLHDLTDPAVRRRSQAPSWSTSATHSSRANSWKGILDFTTCTECGRCQSQCPTWATEKPLSPKLLIMNLRDHAYAKAP